MTAEAPNAFAPPEHECLAQTQRAPLRPRRVWFGAVRDAVVAFVGAVLAIVPHVMHHIGLIAGAAFLTGVGGNALFYVLGLVFSVPMLRRLYGRFGTWRAPAIAIAVFTAVFSLSAFVIGPAISGGDDRGEAPSVPSQGVPSRDSHGH